MYKWFLNWKQQVEHSKGNKKIRFLAGISSIGLRYSCQVISCNFDKHVAWKHIEDFSTCNRQNKNKIFLIRLIEMPILMLNESSFFQLACQYQSDS
jgi:hypothetical protein